ncbi:hypothetical protein OIE67_28945 [Nonomuraea fuscirosea]|uniref:hypothetical protein n=1 Tax=Nonomuraea fuscirosea TaxID=1291556 RepID=UPI002DDBAAE3|nr:hypothetical protein [Nonomuraea fuscirosea]WSA48113.1 hypothetical protein OIE67_28945 [Nonomuraea fuscirosea]
MSLVRCDGIVQIYKARDVELVALRDVDPTIEAGEAGTVGDLVRARSAEIALARLRGHRRARVWRFALTEPLLVLTASVPCDVPV